MIEEIKKGAEAVNDIANNATLEAARKAGQNEAWEMARKIYCDGVDGGFDLENMVDIFGECNLTKVFRDHSYNEVAEKVKIWEEKGIEPGDVVRCNSIYGVVLNCNRRYCSVLTSEGYNRTWEVKKCVKIGRALPVQDWLRQIDGEE